MADDRNLERASKRERENKSKKWKKSKNILLKDWKNDGVFQEAYKAYVCR